MTRVLAFGASVVAGFWDPEGGWVSYLARDLHEAAMEGLADQQVYNLGVSGHHSGQLLSRIEAEIEAREEQEVHELVILLTAGGNDSLYNSRKEDQEVPIEEFKDNLDEILDICKEKAAEVYFISDQPISAEDMDDDMLLSRHALDEEAREKYMEIARRICREKDVTFISISEEVEGSFREKLYDGLHPNRKGHREIYGIVRKYLEKESRLEFPGVDPTN